jgi:hypothetical protein
MESESRPGSAARISLGSNYAQPAVSFEAISGGNELNRVESYLGNRNCCAPYTTGEERAIERVAEVGEQKGPRVAEIAMLKRAYAVREIGNEMFTLGSVYV